MEEKVSIIVPVYNVEQYLARCVDSLLAQTYAYLEIILVDDCSTDGSASIAKKYAEDHPEICIFVQREKNGGLSAARNTGLQTATGHWIAFVDSDDWVTEDYISAMYEVAQRDNADIVMSGISYYYENGNTVPFHPFGSLTTKDSQKMKVALCKPYACTRIYRRELFSKYGIVFPEDIHRAEDIATILPLFTLTDNISILDRSMYFYLQRDASISNTNQKDIDLSFYPKSIQYMFKNAAPGFEEELQFRAISELLYGMTMLMIRSGRSNREIRAHIDETLRQYPNWKANPYLCRLPKAKQWFIRCAASHNCTALRMMIAAWDLKLRLKG